MVMGKQHGILLFVVHVPNVLRIAWFAYVMSCIWQ